MARALSKAEIAKAQTKPGRYGLGDGLYLQITPSGTKSYIYRYKMLGKSRHMGLGKVRDEGVGIDLTEARKRAAKAWLQVRDGIDPVAERMTERQAAKQERERSKTFAECAAVVIANKMKVAKNAKHIAQWESTLKAHVYEVFGQQPVGTITKHDVLAVLAPIWNEIPETASRIRGRIEAVFDYAKAMGYREGDNPAEWKGNLQPILGASEKAQRNQPSLPYAELPRFLTELRKREALAAMALEFAILCAVRSGEVRGATWDEINIQAKLWTIPATRMKAKREHRVPLTDAALAVLAQASALKLADVPYVFPGVRGGTLSDMTLSQLIRRMNGDSPQFVDPVIKAPIVPHGFRSTFRDWAGEATAHPREVIEHALAHQLKDKAEASYHRGDLMDKRRKLMNDWANFCTKPHSEGENVIPINKIVA